MDKDDFLLKMGVHDRTADAESARQIRGVSDLFVHPKYSPSTLENDIALVKLSAPVVFTDEVSPICLPTRQTRVGEVCVAIGWGDLSYGGCKISGAPLPFNMIRQSTSHISKLNKEST